MSHGYVVYGAKGAGSVMVEAALTLLDLPYEVVESAILSGRHEDERLAVVNPLRQVPALVLPSGEVMTESAAILIWLADNHPEARLAPTMAALTRPAFLRWMAFVSSAIYALFWIRDDLSRLVDDPPPARWPRRAPGRGSASARRLMDGAGRIPGAATCWATTSPCSTSTSPWSRAGARAGGGSTRRRRG